MQDNRRQGETAVFFSHSENQAGGRNLLPDHLRDVGGLAGDFAGAFGARAEGEAAGSLHDLGKYGELFKKRLSNEITGVDHWTAGAFVALNSMGRLGIASALAIEGHHIGLQRLTREHLRNLKQLNPLNAPEGLKMSGDLEDLIERFKGDGFQVPKLEKSIYEFRPWQCTASLLDIRMLFSALVDADYLATEAHFNCAHDGSKLFRAPGPDLQASQALTVLDQELSRLAAQRGQSSQDVHALRQDLLSSCRRAAEWDRGLFTLTAPTGAGKTLSMLAFTLKHASKHGLRRIIVVIPYLSIIDQTARTYRALFQPRFGSEYVLEHHSLAVQPKDKDSRPDESRSRLLSENWDAPLIVTTSVQMLESLFAHRPAACRKLHRIASSVILFDEVQTLPAHLAIPSLAAVSHLVGRYGCSVVFSTATQPAFGRLDREVSQECPSGWRPREIVPFDAGLFSRARRISVDWPGSREDRVTWEEVAGRMMAERQVLCIVNLKRHAIGLVKRLEEDRPQGLFHLSTNMCPAHREDVLDQVHEALKRGKDCRLVSTQCIEAGVDIDFPAGFRAFGPFDAVAQAGGRVNRGGRSGLKTLWVFHPPQEESGIYP
ncbi:MAG TPA: CRISPR-associated endonuclease Cas3'', partial [Acidobacteriota bacterium]|nr:CRISPR-associated endonuclease Cas3'' [Acidobacteriota bacterium]